MNVKRTILIILIVLVASTLILSLYHAYREKSPDENSSVQERLGSRDEVSVPASYVGQYRALLSSPDETGLEDILTINPDNTFVWSTEFMSTQKPTVEQGTWTTDGDALVLTIAQNAQGSFQNSLEYRFSPTTQGIYNETDEYELFRQ